MDKCTVTSLAPYAAGLAAVVAVVLTQVWIGKREKRQRRNAAKTEAYAEFAGRCWNLVNYAQILQVIQDHWRSAPMKETQLPAILDPFRVEWDRLNDAWVKVWIHGSDAAINKADELMTEVGEFSELVQAKKAGLIKALFWADRPGKEYAENVAAKLRTIAAQRVAFVHLARKELGREQVEMALERRQRELANRHQPAG